MTSAECQAVLDTLRGVRRAIVRDAGKVSNELWDCRNGLMDAEWIMERALLRAAVPASVEVTP